MKEQIEMYERDTMSKMSAVNALLLARASKDINEEEELTGINKETVVSEINFLVS